MWQAIGEDGTIYWKFFPQPYTDGTASGWATIIVDYLVPVHGDVSADWLYLTNMGLSLGITYWYLASAV